MGSDEMDGVLMGNYSEPMFRTVMFCPPFGGFYFVEFLV
jgi:hypothetical protein